MHFRLSLEKQGWGRGRGCSLEQNLKSFPLKKSLFCCPSEPLVPGMPRGIIGHPTSLCKVLSHSPYFKLQPQPTGLKSLWFSFLLPSAIGRNLLCRGFSDDSIPHGWHHQQEGLSGPVHEHQVPGCPAHEEITLFLENRKWECFCYNNGTLWISLKQCAVLFWNKNSKSSLGGVCIWGSSAKTRREDVPLIPAAMLPIMEF